MKRIILASIVIGIAGCSSISILRTFGSHPIVSASMKVGSNKQSVMAVGGEPVRKQKIINGNGDCWDYILYSGNKQMPYYVAFNNNNMTINGGFITCTEADKNKVLVSGTPIRQIY